MGYRSVVGIMFKRDNKDAASIPTVLALAKTKGILEGDGIGKYWDDKDYGWDDDKFIFYVDDVKWYESYPDVQAMEKLYEFVEELNNESELHSLYSGMFCRIGEEANDTEQRCFGDDPWSEMWLVRDIGFEGGGLLGNQKTTETQTT
jgi:hypothetical protein